MKYFVVAVGMVFALWQGVAVSAPSQNLNSQIENKVAHHDKAATKQEASAVQNLVRAITEGDAYGVEKIINIPNMQLDLNEAFQPDGTTFLMHAVQVAQKEAQQLEAQDDGGLIIFKDTDRVKETLRVIRTLLKAGSDTLAKTLKGRTALHLAIIANNKVDMFLVVDQLIKWQVKKGHSLDTPDNEGRAALHYAVQGTDVRVVNNLLQFGASVNLQDNKGAAPLHFAALKGTDLIVQALVLRHKADKNQRDSEGFTALDWAYKRPQDAEKANIITCLKSEACQIY